VIHRPARSRFQILPMGTRIRSLGWYQPGIRHPSFPTHPSMTATSSATFGDRDRRASTAATGRRIVPSIPESLWGRARGCFSGLVGVPHGREPRGVVGSHRVMPEIHSPGGEITHHAPRMQNGVRGCRATAAVASLNRWRGMLRMAKRRRFSGSVSKSASMKISTVSSLA
jgi:hypothetical protein